MRVRSKLGAQHHDRFNLRRLPAARLGLSTQMRLRRRGRRTQDGPGDPMTTILTQFLVPVAMASVAAVLLLGFINMARRLSLALAISYANACFIPIRRNRYSDARHLDRGSKVELASPARPQENAVILGRKLISQAGRHPYAQFLPDGFWSCRNKSMCFGEGRFASSLSTQLTD
jgi:hypothetical protein